uniref:SFRICE_022941 n=1 Tax=Spodoptera frugiperda TaxID=7108 RepID=A0A2H1VB94_SPOFR
MSADIKNDETNLKSFSGTLKVHRVKGRVSKSPLGFDKCQHFNLGVIHYKIKTKLTVDDIYMESESENEPICSLTHSNPINTCVGTNNMKTNPRDDSIEFQDVAGPSSTKSHYSCEQYKVGDHVLVKFPAKNIEYRYVGIVNQVDDEDAELTVMFMKIRDDKGQMFSIDENDVSGDSGYTLGRYMMTQIINTSPGSPDAYYTDIHTRTRNVTERIIGLLKARFRCLLVHRVLHYSPLVAASIVNACSVAQYLYKGQCRPNTSIVRGGVGVRSNHAAVIGSQPHHDQGATGSASELRDGLAARSTLVTRLSASRTSRQ